MRGTRTTAVLTCLALAGGAMPAALAAQFEGTIAFRMAKGDGEKVDTMIQTTKGQNVRLEGLGGREHWALIFDGDGHRMLMIQPAEKKYFVMTEAEMQMMHARTEALMKQYNKKSADDSEPQVQFSNTGRTETVAGAKCQVWHATTVEDGKKKEGEACIANGIGFVGLSTLTNNPMMRGAGQESKMMETYRKLVGPNKGVLKIVEFKDGKAATMMEAVSINRAPVPAAAFQPPAGYTEVNIGEQMGKMMQGMPKKGTESSKAQ